VVATSPTVIENKTTTKGYLVGQVLLSPTCPVESVLQSNPTCSPKPYAALVDISGQHNFFIELHANVDGRIFVTLPSGEYTLLAHGNSLYPSCETKNVTVMPRATTTTRIMCDSGVR
jgi:hypothetical protein